MFIGVDIGTTNIKVAAFNEAGEAVAERSSPNAATRAFGWDSFDVKGVVASVKKLLKEVVSILGDDRKKIAGIGFASMGETVIPVDDEKPIFDGIYWYETCTKPQFERFCKEINPKQVHKITSLNPSWIYSASKIMKIKEDFEEYYDWAKAFVDVSGLMAFLFSGVLGFDSTIACRTMLLDVQRRCWSDELLAAADIDAEKLPPLKNPGEAWGTIKNEIADELGLPRGIVVTTGGQDHIAAAYGAGIKDDCQAVISIGTSAAFYTPADKSCYLSEAFIKRFYLAGGYSVFKDGAYVLTGMSAGGFCVDWFIHKVLGRDYSILNSFELRESDAIFLPNLRAQMSGFPAGGFTELRDSDTGESLLQSIMESLAFECRYTLEEAFKAKGSPEPRASELVMLGGGAMNPVLMKILAHVMQSQIKIYSSPQSAAAKGAALAAASAAGVGFSQEPLEIAVYEPLDKSLSQYLDKKYLKYLEVFRC